MSESFSSEQPLAPLSVGNVISASIRIYRDHFKSYTGFSLKAMGWSIVAILLSLIFVSITSAVLIGFSSGGNSIIAGIVGGIVIAIITVLILFHFLAKACANSALISRLAYGILTNKPEIPKEAGRQIYPYGKRILRTYILVGLTLGVINFALTLVQTLIANVVGAALGNNFLFSLILNLVFLGIYFWFALHYQIPELPIVIESDVKYSKAAERSWQLSQGFIFKIGLIFTAAFLITLPIFILAFLPLLGVIPTLITLINQSTLGGPPPIDLFQTIGLAYLGTILLFLLLNIIMLPFWQTLKAVVYYDLRNRKEGLDLNLQER